MTGHRQLTKSLNALNQLKQNNPIEFPGILGTQFKGQTLVEVPNREGYVYVQLRSNTNEIIQAYNSMVSPVYGLPVVVVRDTTNNRYVVKSRDLGQYQSWGNSSYQPRHGAQHSFPDYGWGGDIVWVYGRQFTPLCVTPATGTSGGNYVFVNPYVYYLDGVWDYAGGVATPSLLGYKPSDNTAIPVLVYLDASGSVQTLAGSSFSASDTTIGTIIPHLPELPDNSSVPLAVVRLTSGTSAISWNEIFDLRPLIDWWSGTGGTGSSGVDRLSELNDVNIPSPNDGDVLTWDEGTSRWIAAPCSSTGTTSGITLQDVYPIGAIYMSVNATNPGTVFGFGTWTAFGTGRVLIGVDGADPDFNTVEKTGGAKTVQSSAQVFAGDALASHQHAGISAGTPSGTVSAPIFTGDLLAAHIHSGTSAGTPAGTVSYPANVPIFSGTSTTDIVNHTHDVNVGSANDTSTVTGAGNIFAGTTNSVIATTGNPKTGGVASYKPAGTITWPTNPLTFGGSALSQHQHANASAGTPAGTNTAPIFSGLALPSHQHAGISAGTPAGTNTPGAATSVVQPYITCYFWKRTA